MSRLGIKRHQWFLSEERSAAKRGKFKRSSEMPKLLAFKAPWCQPCKLLEPILDKLERRATVEKIDIEKDMDIAQRYGVKGVPFVVLLDDQDRELGRHQGAMREHELNSWIDGLINQ
jgi:thioredoxin-like negative regulator of GroEL